MPTDTCRSAPPPPSVRLALEDVAAFHAERFQPSRATARRRRTAGARRPAPPGRGRVFGGWEETSPSLQGHPAGDVEPMASQTRLAVVAREAAPQSELRIGHLSAHRNSPDYPALLVMNAVLGGQFVSRINLKLREEKGYTYGARTRIRLAPRDRALFAAGERPHGGDRRRDRRLLCRTGRRSEVDGRRRTRRWRWRRRRSRAGIRAGSRPRTRSRVPSPSLRCTDLPDTYFEEFVPRVQRDSVRRRRPRRRAVRRSRAHRHARRRGLSGGRTDRSGRSVSASRRCCPPTCDDGPLEAGHY